ncbi:MAG: SH3 domain-containing protein [Acidobacteriota bacterium]
MRLNVSRLGLAAALAVGLSGCASAPPPPPPAPEPAQAPEPAPAPQAAEISWIVPKTVNVREAPSTKAATVAKASKGARLTSFEEKDGWVRVKLPDKRIGWVKKDLLKKDDGCLPDRKEVLIEPPMLRVSDTPGAKGKVVVEADIDETGSVKTVRVITNETGSPDRAESVKAEVRTVKFQPPVRRCKVTGFTYVYSRTF